MLQFSHQFCLLILCRDKFVPVKIICVRFHQPPPPSEWGPVSLVRWEHQRAGQSRLRSWSWWQSGLCWRYLLSPLEPGKYNNWLMFCYTKIVLQCLFSPLILDLIRQSGQVWKQPDNLILRLQFSKGPSRLSVPEKHNWATQHFSKYFIVFVGWNW